MLQDAPAATRDDPSVYSGDRRSMELAWTLIGDVLAGATEVRRKNEYLPRYDNESQRDYDRRREMSPWQPEFEDCLNAMVARPFAKDVVLTEASSRVRDIQENIDGRGNSLTAFAKEAFYRAIAKGVHFIWVDYPDMHPTGTVLTVRDEKQAGARPYWVHVDAQDVIALYSAWDGGREVITHFRFRESYVKREQFGEVTGTRIRVYEPGHWWVYEKEGSASTWTMVKEGVINRAGRYNSVPLVPFFTGTRLGDLQVRPPVLQLANMQIQLFRALSRKEEILDFASSPILTANGMIKPPDGSPVTVGPRAILYAPPSAGNGGSPNWAYINPDADNIKEIRSDVRDIIDDMKRLGLQPLVARTGRQTATGDSIEAAKAHSAVKSWALGLKDVLEQAFVYTGQWMDETTFASAAVYTDFRDIPAGQAPLDALATARASADISRRTYWAGLVRWDALPADFDPDAEEEALEDEAEEDKAKLPPPPPLPKRDPATGEVVNTRETQLLQQTQGQPAPVAPEGSPPRRE